jgi:tetratricopeptide (TPR) repeat protein
MNKWMAVAGAIIGISVVAGVAIHFSQPKPSPKAGAKIQAESPTDPGATPDQPAVTIPATRRPSRPQVFATGDDAQGLAGTRADLPASASAANPAGAALVSQAVEVLVSPQSNFGQRQAALDQLRNSGKLDQAISELERRMAGDPRSAECAAALGRAYLQKCGTLQDLREQGILAMKADQVFDAALNNDPNNWDARFTKAVAMSYWPTQMNKGTEVIQHFTTLIEQQSAQAPQPQFALTYAWMGDAYQKYGHSEYAQQIWQQGAALFPENQEIKNKLAGR